MARQKNSSAKVASSRTVSTPSSSPSPKTYLEARRDEMGWSPPRKRHEPAWRVEKANERFAWIMDGDRAVGLLDAKELNFELLASDPWSPTQPPVLPLYYHICTYRGLRVIFCWRLKVWSAARTHASMTWKVEGSAMRFEVRQEWADGSHGLHSAEVAFDPRWGAYVATMEATLVARRAVCAQEFCNLIPACIGDTRPGRTKYRHLLWLDSAGALKKMGKNPLWFDSVGAQDFGGRRRIQHGGFMGWVAEPDMNPVIEILEADPPAGGCTCDNLMDEHMMLLAPDGRNSPTGWFHLRTRFRLFSIPLPLAETLEKEATDLEFGPMLAWKFQYAPGKGPIGSDLNRVELPGMLPYVKADFNTPVPWDKPFFGLIWTASSHPDADLYYDPKIGHAGRRSLRITVEGGQKRFSPGSGPTIHTESGQRYRISAWIRTHGNVRAWVEANEVLFNSWNAVQPHPTTAVSPDSDWTRVEASYVARGDEAPFAAIFIVAEGNGMAWYDEIAFEPI